MYKVIVLLTFVAAASAGILQTLECPNAGDASIGYLDEVYSPNFTETERIILKNRATYTFGMKFYAGYNSPTLVPAIYAIIGGIEAPWTGAGNDACVNLVESSCPLVQDDYYHYVAHLTVPAVGSLNNIIFQWALKDTKNAGGKSQSCFRMNVDIAA